jgi:hypothetical protein
MLLRNLGASRPRRGVILLVVLALLTLFAILGVTFVLYAQAEETAARVARDAESLTVPDMEPELLLALFLGQLLYDVGDDDVGVSSGLRGHSLARLQYGADDAGRNDVPFNGSGRLHYPSPFAGLGLPGVPSEALDDYYLVNYTWFPNDPQMPPGQRFLRDPERFGRRGGVGSPRGPYTGGANAPYTYPDLNNMALAAVRADGVVLLPSFHRPWLFGSNDPAGNPNWTNAAGKYLLLRPRPIDMGPGFPYPDANGDVKNLLGGPGGNDSYWLDLNAPVMQAPNGRRYKPLFAPLVVDLDNRVNLNVHGNVRGRNQAHVSNLGFGPWEVNPRRLVGAGVTAPAAYVQEWSQILLGSASLGRGGRYGGAPWAGKFGGPGLAPNNVAPPGPTLRFYNAIDFDGCNDGTGGAATAAIGLPGFGAPPMSCFPTYPPGYGNASLRERTDHPLVYNPFAPTGDDRAFPVMNVEALLRYGDTGSPALSSEFLGLCPQNLGGSAPATDPLGAAGAARRRRLVTTTSFDLDKPGVTPWVWDPSASLYTLPAGSRQPQGGSIAFPILPPRPAAPPPGSEFGTDLRAGDAVLGRIDVNRPLPDYPRADPAAGRITDGAAFAAAQQARVQLARDIYDRLRAVVGATDPATAAARAAAGAPQEFDALRWLAQLAVNVVDYVDADDFMTPFNWYTDGAGNSQWVFGVELPRLVVNEVYAEVENDPADPGPSAVPPQATLPFLVNFWVELHNPFRADATLSDGAAARLQMPASGALPSYAIYQLVIAQSPAAYLRQPDQVLGDPAAGQTLTAVWDTTPQPPPAPPPGPGVDVNLVQPANDSYSGPDGGNQGFYVLGPKYDFPGTDPSRPNATLRAQEGPGAGLTYSLPNTTALSPPPSHALLLRRLACPLLPPNPATPGGAVDPTQPYNPYVTVDYLDGVATNDAVAADSQGPHNATPVAQRVSWGRKQPYAADASQQLAQQPAPALDGQPQHTFFRHNGQEAAPPNAPGPGQTLQVPFDWLVHLDRPVISAPQLLHVCAFKPHELTQQFRTPAGPFQHTADWFDPGRRIYRALEFLTAGCRVAGAAGAPGGRVPGKINLNTVWDPETLLALCDPQPGNNFRDADVYLPPGIGPGYDYVNDPQTIFWRMAARRTPGLLTGGGPGPTDRPFLGLATGAVLPGTQQYPNGAGIEDTLLRSFDGSARRLFQPPAPPPGDPNAHPYLQSQLLTKIFNSVTTRSNVFAVWLTVGFFEVTDATARPVKLGAEVGLGEGRNRRHRMFAVVDRTGMRRFATSCPTPVAAAGTTTVTPAAMSGTANGVPWSIQAGAVLEIDTGPAAETVVVAAVTATTFTAAFARPHNAAAGPWPIVGRGNSGPRPRYDPRADNEVVLFVSVID